MNTYVVTFIGKKNNDELKVGVATSRGWDAAQVSALESIESMGYHDYSIVDIEIDDNANIGVIM